MKKFVLIFFVLAMCGFFYAPQITPRTQAGFFFRSIYGLSKLGKVAGVLRWNTSQNTKLTNGLVSLWSFNGPDIDINSNTAYDRISGFNGTLLSFATATAYVPGRVGQALQFDGVATRVNIPDTTNLRPAAFTLSAWFSCPNFSSGYTIISKARSTAPWSSPFTSWLIRINSSSIIEFGLSNGSYSGTTATGLSLLTDTWFHVAMTYDGVSARTGYLNAASILSNSLTAPIGYAAQPVLIGADHGASPVGDIAPCKIDDVRVYNYALSAAEIKNLYFLGR